MQNVPFIKMNGTGNDFVIFDARKAPVHLTPEQIRQLSSRSNTVTHGCDQIIVMEPSQKADIFMRIYNADSSEVDACGNATRCVAEIMEKELHKIATSPITIETNADILKGIRRIHFNGKDHILVDMGKPKFNWQDIPLSVPAENAAKLIKERTQLEATPYYVNMGNPHVIFFLKNYLQAANKIAEIGPQLENSKDIFPKGVNVSFAEYRDDTIYARVWERGAGLTKACGTAACALLVALNKINPVIVVANVTFESKDSSQTVKVTIENNGHVLLGGLIEEEFRGIINL